MRTQAKRANVFALLALVLSGCVIATDYGGGDRMKQSEPGKKTHCLGRYLIDLPADASLRSRYKFADGTIASFPGVTQQEFERRMAAREAELEGSRHGHGGGMLVDRVEFAPGRRMYVSWASPNSRGLYRYQDVAYFRGEQVLYVFEGDGDATPQARADAQAFGQELLTRTLRYRANEEIPDEAGFCFDRGFIADRELNQEEFTAGIGLKRYPGVSIKLMSYVTGKPDMDLLKRASNVPPGFEGAVARMKTLRRGERNIGPLKGQELLVRGDDGGRRSYHFLWETQGRANSLAFPFMSLELSTSGETAASPASDEEMLEIWDSILATLRPRPGAT